MRVNDQAKETGKTSKEVLDVFQKENQDVKSNSSNMTDAQAGMGKKASDGAGDKKAEGDSP